MKIKPAVLLLSATLGLGLVAGLTLVLLTRLNHLTNEGRWLVLLLPIGLIILLSVLLRGETRKSEHALRQTLATLGFERENWISRQYRGTFNGHEYEILPFYIRGFGDILALQILLRGTFQEPLVVALPRGLNNFLVWGTELGGQFQPEGYAGYQVYAQDRQAAQAMLARSEIESRLKDLFTVPSQTPMVLEISTGVMRLRVGELGLLGFDEQMLQRWLLILGELGGQIGSLGAFNYLSEAEELTMPQTKIKMRWIGILGILFALGLSATLFYILLNSLK